MLPKDLMELKQSTILNSNTTWLMVIANGQIALTVHLPTAIGIYRVHLVPSIMNLFFIKLPDQICWRRRMDSQCVAILRNCVNWRISLKVEPRHLSLMQPNRKVCHQDTFVSIKFKTVMNKDGGLNSKRTQKQKFYTKMKEFKSTKWKASKIWRRIIHNTGTKLK